MQIAATLICDVDQVIGLLCVPVEKIMKFPTFFFFSNKFWLILKVPLRDNCLIYVPTCPECNFSLTSPSEVPETFAPIIFFCFFEFCLFGEK